MHTFLKNNMINRTVWLITIYFVHFNPFLLLSLIITYI